MSETLTPMNIFDQISIRIIKEQEQIIGPIAWDEARKIDGLNVIDQKAAKVTLTGDPQAILNNLVSRYAKLFGRASDEVCKEAVVDLIAELPAQDVPSSLK